MKFTITVKKDLDLKGQNFRLGKNAQVHLHEASRSLIHLLRYFFLTQPDAIEGSRAALTFLFSFPGHPMDEEFDDLDDFIKRFVVKPTAQD